MNEEGMRTSGQQFEFFSHLRCCFQGQKEHVATKETCSVLSSRTITSGESANLQNDKKKKQ